MVHSIRLKCAKHDVCHIHQPLQRDIKYMIIIVKNGLIVRKNQSRRSSCVPVKSDQRRRYCLSKHYDRYIRVTPIFIQETICSRSCYFFASDQSNQRHFNLLSKFD